MSFEYLTDWSGIDKALAAWFIAATGLGAGKFIWVDQAVGSPAKPYGTLKKLVVGEMAGLDAELYVYNSGADKLDQIVYGTRRMTVQCTIYDDPQAAAGALNPQTRLLQAVAALRLQSYKDAMNAVGLAFLQTLTGVREIDDITGERWEKRATIDLEFGFTSAYAEVADSSNGVDYIETFADPDVTFE